MKSLFSVIDIIDSRYLWLALVVPFILLLALDPGNVYYLFHKYSFYRQTSIITLSFHFILSLLLVVIQNPLHKYIRKKEPVLNIGSFSVVLVILIFMFTLFIHEVVTLFQQHSVLISSACMLIGITISTGYLYFVIKR